MDVGKIFKAQPLVTESASDKHPQKQQHNQQQHSDSKKPSTQVPLAAPTREQMIATAQEISELNRQIADTKTILSYLEQKTKVNNRRNSMTTAIREFRSKLRVKKDRKNFDRTL